MNKLVFKLFCVMLLVSCSARIPIENTDGIEIHFCPKENCAKFLESYIKGANFSIHCAFYDLDLENVISQLSNKSKEIDVRLVMDKDNYEGQLSGDGYKLDTDSQLMHNKFCIIDKNLVLTGSMNPTHNDNEKNSNNFLAIHSKILSQNYLDEFDELWKRRFSGGEKIKNEKVIINKIEIKNHFCPEDECAKSVVKQINLAKSSVYFMIFSFTNDDIANSIIAKKDLDVKGVLDTGQAAGKYSSFEKLKSAGIDVEKDKIPGKLHHKVFIIDNSTVITGSFNPTGGGDDKNDENLLIIHDKGIANQFLEEFDRIYNAKS